MRIPVTGVLALGGGEMTGRAAWNLHAGGGEVGITGWYRALQVEPSGGKHRIVVLVDLHTVQVVYVMIIVLVAGQCMQQEPVQAQSTAIQTHQKDLEPCVTQTALQGRI